MSGPVQEYLTHFGDVHAGQLAAAEAAPVSAVRLASVAAVAKNMRSMGLVPVCWLSAQRAIHARTLRDPAPPRSALCHDTSRRGVTPVSPTQLLGSCGRGLSRGAEQTEQTEQKT